MNEAPNGDPAVSQAIEPTTAPTGQDWTGRLLFIGAIFASAFLIFLVQPMVGKRILPWFGGAPAVWTLCLAFYQTTLFLGYAYAHLLIRFASPAGQLGIHAFTVAAALVALPVLPDQSWIPDTLAGDDGSPIGQILAMLSANVALPFLVLASTGPLLQAWFARRYPASSPYPLYALSNVGSLLALLSYPVLIEPQLGLSDTGTLWSVGFAAAAASVLGCAILAWRAVANPNTRSAAPSSEGPEAEPLNAARVFLWFLLAASAVLLLMGVTNKLCLDVASVPFVWIVPLAAYLVSFIVCFGSERNYRRPAYITLAVVALFASLGSPLWVPWLDGPLQSLYSSAISQGIILCTLLFAGCMVLHGELYRLRPSPHKLTTFYLSLSAGGAIGGIFTSFLAPQIFNEYYELELGVAIAGLAVVLAWSRDPDGVLIRLSPLGRRSIMAVVTLVPLAHVSWNIARPIDGLEHQERGFFGVVKVLQTDGTKNPAQRRLMNGSTLHGVQFLDQAFRRVPSTYYGRATGLALALTPSEKPAPARRIGVIGLGAGTLATYGQKDDLVRFYEIDPAVVAIARNPDFFSFLADSPARVEVVVGDARLALASELARGEEQAFDLLIVDAFSSDAVPVHLLTREAFEHYAKALAPGGLLVVHATNRNLRLMPLISRLGSEVGMESLQTVNKKLPKYQSAMSSWVLLSHNPQRIQGLMQQYERRSRMLKFPPESTRAWIPSPVDLKLAPLWTDDYSDLFGLLKGIR